MVWSLQSGYKKFFLAPTKRKVVSYNSQFWGVGRIGMTAKANYSSKKSVRKCLVLWLTLCSECMSGEVFLLQHQMFASSPTCERSDESMGRSSINLSSLCLWSHITQGFNGIRSDALLSLSHNNRVVNFSLCFLCPSPLCAAKFTCLDFTVARRDPWFTSCRYHSGFRVLL